MPPKGSYKFQRLCRAVIDKSSSNDFNEATSEWEIFSIGNNPNETCVCSHHPISTVYGLYNKTTSNRLYPIGNECISHFQRPDLSNSAKVLRKKNKVAKIDGSEHLYSAIAQDGELARDIYLNKKRMHHSTRKAVMNYVTEFNKMNSIKKDELLPPQPSVE